jgi:uncharacterized protein (DUF1800 family)
MGDENTVLTPAEARHLLRRTGFGAPRADVARLLDAGETRGQAADRLLAFPAKRVRPRGRDFASAHNKWVKLMLKTKAPLQMKLGLFWHDHFATGFSKVQDVDLMAGQIQLLHERCAANVRDFVKAVNKDPAMMEWLDTARNQDTQPNENYARELMELFTLGVEDAAGNPNYTQDDIVQIARAFTGWRYDGNGVAVLVADQHDFAAGWPARGPKVIFTTTGGFGPGGRDFTVNGEGEPEIDTVTDILFEHTDSQGQRTVARRIARRLLEYFAHPSPDQSFVDAVVAASGFATTWELGPLLRAIFVHDDFYLSGAPAPFGAATRKSVKWPVDYLVGTVRMLEMKLKSRYLYVDGGSFRTALDQLTNMGQVLLDPPSVFGWDWETAWVSSATLLARYGFARDLAAARGARGTSLRPDRLIALSLTDAGDIVDAVTDVLGLTDQLTGAERQILIDYLSDGGLNPTLDLTDYDTRNAKLHGLFALVLQSPAYQLH